jgi:hypothetical protein
MKVEHPRFRYYPHHRDYVELAAEFRPFVMTTHQPHYRSKSVNTDKFGLREQYDASGRFVDLEQMKAVYDRCDVLVGGSTGFGVDATSDRATVSQFLSVGSRLCFNLGVRGATSQQELILFLWAKRYLPEVRNVILLSGVNNCSLASLEATIFYPDFGGIFSEEYHFDSFLRQYAYSGSHESFQVKHRLCRRVDRLFAKSSWARSLARALFGRNPCPIVAQDRYDFEAKVQLVNRFLENDLQNWACLQRGLGCKVHFVLQPAISWTAKPLTAIERECFEADLQRIASMKRYTSAEFHRRYREQIEGICLACGIDFHDANPWLAEPQFKGLDLFTDVCHLTDEGNRILAGLLRHRLDWKD